MLKLQPFNIKLFRELVEETDQQIQKFSGNDVIVLFIGISGAGKSTLIQYLAGSKLTKTKVQNENGSELDHIHVQNFPEDGDDDLTNVKLSASSVSETRFLRAIKVKFAQGQRKDEIILCDSPGIMDSRGTELDVANQYGLIETAKKCKGVVPVVVLSDQTMGERCIGLKGISKIISGMFNNSQNHFDQFQFMFTKYEDNQEKRKDISNKINDSYVRLTPKEKIDDNFVAFFEELTAKIDPKEEILIIDPLNQNDFVRKTHLKFLKKCQAIENPTQAFKMNLHEGQKQAISSMIQQDIDLLRKYAIPQSLYWITEQKLKDLVFMDQKLTKVPQVSQKLKEIVQYIVDDRLKKQILDCEEQRDKIFESAYNIDDSFIASITTLKKDLEEYRKIFTHLGFTKLSEDAEISPQRTHTFLLDFMKAIKVKLEKKAQSANYLPEESTKVLLANLENIFRCFQGQKNEDAENYLTGVQQLIQNSIDQLVSEVNRAIDSNFHLDQNKRRNEPEELKDDSMDVDQIVKQPQIIDQENSNIEELSAKMTYFFKCVDNLSQFYPNYITYRQNLLKKLRDKVNGICEPGNKGTARLNISTHENLLKVSAQEIEQCLRVLKNAHGCYNFKKLLQEFDPEIEKMIGENLKDIIQKVNENYKTTFFKLQEEVFQGHSLEDGTEQRHDDLKKRMMFLQQVWQELRSFIEDNMECNPHQLFQDLEFSMNTKFNQFLSSLEAHAVQGRQLVTYYKQLNALRWLDDFQKIFSGENHHQEGSNLVSQKYRDIQRALLGDESSYFQHQVSKIRLSFIRNDFVNMYQCFKNLETIKEILVDQNNKDLYAALKDEIKTRIKKYLDESEKKIDEIDFSHAQKLLKFFESYKVEERGPNFGKDHDELVEKAHADFLARLKLKADQDLIWKQPGEETAQEDAQKVYKILYNLKDCTQTKPELENAINSKRRFEEIIDNMKEFVTEQQQNLTNYSNQEMVPQIEELTKYMTSIMQLNKFIDSTEPNISTIKKSCQTRLLALGTLERQNFSQCLLEDYQLDDAFLLLKSIFEQGQHFVQKANVQITRKNHSLIKLLAGASKTLRKDSRPELFDNWQEKIVACENFKKFILDQVIEDPLAEESKRGQIPDEKLQQFKTQYTKLQEALSQQMTKSVKWMNTVYNEKLRDINKLLSNNNYKDSLKSQDDIQQIKGELTYISELNKTIQIDVQIQLESDVGKKKKKFQTISYKEFTRYSPREFICCLQEAENPSYNNEIRCIKQELRTRFMTDIQKLEEQLSGQQFDQNGDPIVIIAGLKNQTLKDMKLAVRQLPDCLQTEINEAIQNFETEFKNNEQESMEGLIQILKFDKSQNNEQEIIGFIDRARLMKQDANIKKIEKIIMDNVKLASAGIHDALKYKNIHLIHDHFRQLTKYKTTQAKLTNLDLFVKHEISEIKKTIAKILDDEGRAFLNEDGPIYSDVSINQNDLKYLQEFAIKLQLLKYCLKNQDQREGNDQQSITQYLELDQDAEQFIERVQNFYKKINELVQQTAQLLEGEDNDFDPDNINQISRILNAHKNIRPFEESIAQICDKSLEGARTISFPSFETNILSSIKVDLAKIENSFAPEKAKLEGDRIKHYEGLAKTYKRIKQLSEFKSKDQVVFENQTVALSELPNAIRVSLLNQITKVTHEKIKILQNSQAFLTHIGKEEGAEIDHIFKNLDSFNLCFSQEFQKTKELQIEMELEVMKIVQCQVHEFQNKKSISELLKSLIGMKCLAEVASIWSKKINGRIDILLDELPSLKYQDGNVDVDVSNLYIALEKSDSQFAKSIVAGHSHFKKQVLGHVNKMIHSPEFDHRYIFRKIWAQNYEEQDEDDSDAEGGLLNMIRIPFNAAKNLYKTFCRKPEAINIKSLEKNYLEFQKTYGVEDENMKNGFTGLLGKFLKPNPNFQEIKKELHAILPKQQPGQKFVMTTQISKKIPQIVAYVFVIWTLQTVEHHFSEGCNHKSCDYLMTPHAAQVISIFRMLGLGNEKRDDVSLSNHLVQIKTGEGKSITLGVTSATLALLGADVYCGCYSQHLSMRDEEDFKNLFVELDVEQHIKYGTLEELCESVINERGNVRDTVLLKISQQGVALPSQEPKSRLKILLIDEVDVFFDKGFYGNTYCPVAILKSDHLQELLTFIWNNRNDRPKISLNNVKASPIYQKCLTDIGDYKNLLDEGLKDMIFEVNDIDTHRDYIVKNNKIGYKIGERYHFNAQQGYLTQFAYLREQQAKKVTEDAMKQNLGLLIKCGEFSYAETPKKFDIILGVTGTLEQISETQRRIMVGNYAIRKETYIPSIFGDNLLKFAPQDNFQSVNSAEFYNRLTLNINQGLMSKIDASILQARATIVLFENETKLLDYYNSEDMKVMKKDVNYLTEAASIDEIKDIVQKVSRPGQITLLTRNFGRGSDFIVRNNGLLMHGGVHNIQTFGSESLSEDAQIKGRTARQGQQGSYSLLLKKQDLEKYILTIDEIDNLVKDQQFKELYEKYLDGMKQNNKIVHEDNSKNVAQQQKENEKANNFANYLFSARKDFKPLLFGFNKGKSLAGKVTKSLILIDATGSMYGLISKTKATVQIMFDKIQEILIDMGQEPSQALMKIGFYSNYNVNKKNIYVESGWEYQSAKIKQFLGQNDVRGGWGNEAVEVGLFHAIKHIDTGLSQIIVIGDQPANTAAEFDYKRAQDQGHDYWNKHFPGLESSEPLVEKIKAKGVPIHTMYLTSNAKTQFGQMSSETKGQSHNLDVNDSNADDKLVEVISVTVLKDQGQDFVERYKVKNGLKFMHS